MSDIFLTNSMACCGCDELANIYDETPEEILQMAYDNWTLDGDRTKGPPFIVFSTTNEHKGGHKLAAYVKKHKLGSVMGPTRNKVNPNSNNSLRVWVWTVSAAGWHRWAKKQDWYADWVKDCASQSFYP